MKKNFLHRLIFTASLSLTSVAVLAQLDPNTAPKTPVDRFSPEAGTLMVRDIGNGLPGPNMPVDFDNPPFITKGLGPNGERVEYYNFDVMPTKPAPIFVLIRTGDSVPVSNQLNIIDVKPGDQGYNDFWHVHLVTVPVSYVANTVTSAQAIVSAGYSIQQTSILVNCPVVPEGSTAKKRLNGGDTSLTRGWYKDSVVYYFNFLEKDLMITGDTMVPTSPIYVTFKINPGMPGGGPPSGFVTETASLQTHNVIATLPSHGSYSPLWRVNVYDNADFNSVMNLSTAASANILATAVADVNCPVVLIMSGTGVQDSEFGHSLSLYPNPATDHFILRWQGETDGIVSISLVNMLGKTLMVSDEPGSSALEKAYDISALSPGIYFVRISYKGTTISEKLVKGN